MSYVLYNYTHSGEHCKSRVRAIKCYLAGTRRWTEDAAQWLAAELRLESGHPGAIGVSTRRQAMHAMLLARHEALLRSLKPEELRLELSHVSFITLWPS